MQKSIFNKIILVLCRIEWVDFPSPLVGAIRCTRSAIPTEALSRINEIKKKQQFSCSVITPAGDVEAGTPSRAVASYPFL